QSVFEDRQRAPTCRKNPSRWKIRHRNGRRSILPASAPGTQILASRQRFREEKHESERGAFMKPKLAFVSLWNAADPNAESGYAYSMRKQLKKRFNVVDLFPLDFPYERFWYPLLAMYN